jgi:diguanylate cyclase
MVMSSGVRAASAPLVGQRDEILTRLQRAGIALTAENYAVWQEYHAGTDPKLRRAMDILLTNGRVPDQRALNQLYARYCAPERDAAAFRDIARRALATLQDVTGMMGDMQGAATDYGASLRGISAGLAGANAAVLRPLVQRLADDTIDMIAHSEALVRRLDQSTERIAALEQFLTQARQEAATDPLTGLANRRAFDAALMKAAGDAMNTDAPLSVLIGDVDHFKQVNDRFGHDIGDAALRMVAQAITQAVRGRDTASRYGGEEFAVILPDTAQAGAVVVAEHVREAVMRAGLAVPGQDDLLSVTLSIGISTYDLGEKLAQLVSRADAALYCAKQNGRNRTEVAGAPRPPP